MVKLHLGTQHKNLQKNKKGMKQQVDTQTKILGATLYLKASSQSLISITSEQLAELKWLIEQYGKAKPGWLRQQFKLNQRRAKMLNDCLREAQLDEIYCGKCSGFDDWTVLLHMVWHKINGVKECE